MTRIVFDRSDDLLATNLQQVRHRQSYLQRLLARLDEAPREEPEAYRDYDVWYLGVLEDGLLRRGLVVEYHEWCRHVQDLLRDQLSRNGYDSGYWDEVKAAEHGSFVSRVRRVLDDVLKAGLPAALWDSLEEIGAVAEAIANSTRETRAALAARYPDYFEPIDAFGDGDAAGRLTLRPAHLERAFATVARFWDPQSGLPHRIVDGAA